MTTAIGSPKKHWQTQDNLWAKAHQDLVTQPHIREALLRAYATYCWHLPNTGASPQEALCANAKREGAQGLIDTFLGLAEVHVPKSKRDPGDLEEQIPPSQQFTAPVTVRKPQPLE